MGRSAFNMYYTYRRQRINNGSNRVGYRRGSGAARQSDHILFELCIKENKKHVRTIMIH